MSEWLSFTNEREKYAAYLAGREWGLLKEQVRERAGGMCERCRMNDMAAVHHLTYIRKYNEKLEDLQAICNECHEFTHGKNDHDPAAIRPQRRIPPGVYDVIIRECEIDRSIDRTTHIRLKCLIMEGAFRDLHLEMYYPFQLNGPEGLPAENHIVACGRMRFGEVCRAVQVLKPVSADELVGKVLHEFRYP